MHVFFKFFLSIVLDTRVPYFHYFKATPDMYSFKHAKQHSLSHIIVFWQLYKALYTLYYFCTSLILTALLEIHDCSIRIYTYLIMIITASLIRSCKATPPELLLACSVFSGRIMLKNLLPKIPTHWFSIYFTSSPIIPIKLQLCLSQCKFWLNESSEVEQLGITDDGKSWSVILYHHC